MGIVPHAAVVLFVPLPKFVPLLNGDNGKDGKEDEEDGNGVGNDVGKELINGLPGTLKTLEVWNEEDVVDADTEPESDPRYGGRCGHERRPQYESPLVSS
jgi:hypothetical protein